MLQKLKLALLLVVAAMAVRASDDEEIATLRRQIVEQQKQLDTLQATLARQQQLLDRALAARYTVPTPAPLVRPATPAGVATPRNPCAEPGDTNAVPPYLRLGNVCIQPIGFMDMTAVWRDKDAGSSIGSNFGSIPFNNVPASKLSEVRLSPQNSRIGFRIDGLVGKTHIIGYNEFDFLSSATPASSGVSNGAVVPRLRLFWVDVRRDKFEFLAGQSWSMLVPNRSGISPLPADLFYSQVVDVNYVAGLPWTRQAGVRALYHPSSKLTLGVSVENPNQYIGGSAGGSGITLPSNPALTASAGSELDNTGGGFLSTPNRAPDVIGKVAFDPNSNAHVEIAGFARSFKIWNGANNTYSTAAGLGGAINANIQVLSHTRLITNNFFGAGGGRYLFGQAPDVVVRADGSLQPVHAAGFVEGIEYARTNWLGYLYYGDVYINRAALLDANGRSPIGYGHAGSPNSQNRNIQELTFGTNQTLWRDVRYGAINLMLQYEYLLRYPWFVAPGSPKAAHDNTVYVNIRYTLPGSAPRF